MSAPYRIGVGIAGTRACVVVERDGRRFTVAPWETGAQSTHAAALIAIERAAHLRVSTRAPREIFLRQNTAVQAYAADDGLAAVLLEGHATLTWRSPKAPGGDHPLVVAALIELGVPASALSAGAP
jgi:hypothetical protein